MKKEHHILIDTEKCIGCGLCRRDCPASNIQLVDKKAGILSQDCIKCGHCVAICPMTAVSITGFDEPPVKIEAPTTLPPLMLLDALRTRRSIRQFTKQQISPEVIEQIIEAGRLTPTAKNSQDVSFIVLKDEMDRFEKIAVQFFKRLLPLVKLVNPVAKRTIIDDHFFFKKAQAAIIIVSKDTISGALAAANMALTAEACGLGVLYSGFFSTAVNRSRSLRRKLGLNRKDQVVLTLVLGYSSVVYRRTTQKEAASVRYV